MRTEEMLKISFSSYNANDINKLKSSKNIIQRITNKYISTNEHDRKLIWDNMEQMNDDAINIASIMEFMAPIIGYLEGLSNLGDEIKKLNMAKFQDAMEEEGQFIENVENDTVNEKKTKKKITIKEKEIKSRVQSEEIITCIVNLTAMSYEYRKFQYQTNRWLDIIYYRLKALEGEKRHAGQFGEPR